MQISFQCFYNLLEFVGALEKRNVLKGNSTTPIIGKNKLKIIVILTKFKMHPTVQSITQALAERIEVYSKSNL